MLDHDRERLENIYPDGIPETVVGAVDRFQKSFHKHFGTGPISGEMLNLIVVMHEESVGERYVIPPEGPHRIIEDDVTEDEEQPVEEVNPLRDEPVNWYATKNGTEVICSTDQGDIRGVLVGMFRKGEDKGLLKIELPGSQNEFDTFHPSKVRIAQ